MPIYAKLETEMKRLLLFCLFLLAFFTVINVSGTQPTYAGRHGCTLALNPPRPSPRQGFVVTATNLQSGQVYEVVYYKVGIAAIGGILPFQVATANSTGIIRVGFPALLPGQYTILVRKQGEALCQTLVQNYAPGVGTPARGFRCSGNNICQETSGENSEFWYQSDCASICKRVGDDARNRRATPINPRGTCADGQIDTAIGCIPFRDANSFVAWFLRWAIGIAGGIAFLLIIFSGFQIMTASNNPQQLQTGRELLTGAVSGLILIIFSAFLLKLIGVDILGIPGLGSP